MGHKLWFPAWKSHSPHTRSALIFHYIDPRALDVNCKVWNRPTWKLFWGHTWLIQTTAISFCNYPSLHDSDMWLLSHFWYSFYKSKVCSCETAQCLWLIQTVINHTKPVISHMHLWSCCRSLSSHIYFLCLAISDFCLLPLTGHWPLFNIVMHSFATACIPSDLQLWSPEHLIPFDTVCHSGCNCHLLKAFKNHQKLLSIGCMTVYLSSHQNIGLPEKLPSKS